MLVVSVHRVNSYKFWFYVCQNVRSTCDLLLKLYLFKFKIV